MPVLRANSELTRARLLNAAERCFADHGYEGASLRDITRRAGVNLAAVNYHFSSKKELWLDVMDRRLRPLNEERLRMLKEARARLPRGQRLGIDPIMEAMIVPFGRMFSTGPKTCPILARMIGRALTESHSLRQELNRRGLDATARIFRGLLHEALPELPEDELDWRFYFLTSAMLAALARGGQQAGIRRPLDTRNVEAMMRRLVVFVCGGLPAAPAKPGK